PPSSRLGGAGGTDGRPHGWLLSTSLAVRVRPGCVGFELRSFLHPDPRKGRRDPGPFAGLAVDRVRPSRDQGTLAHHHGPEMTLRGRSARVESSAVIGDCELHAILFLLEHDLDLARLGMLEG